MDNGELKEAFEAFKAYKDRLEELFELGETDKASGEELEKIARLCRVPPRTAHSKGIIIENGELNFFRTAQARHNWDQTLRTLCRKAMEYEPEVPSRPLEVFK
jgi:hypothetical protein